MLAQSQRRDSPQTSFWTFRTLPTVGPACPDPQCLLFWSQPEICWIAQHQHGGLHNKDRSQINHLLISWSSRSPMEDRIWDSKKETMMVQYFNIWFKPQWAGHWGAPTADKRTPWNHFQQTFWFDKTSGSPFDSRSFGDLAQGNPPFRSFSLGIVEGIPPHCKL